MTRIEILEELKKLSTTERLTIIEATVHLIYKDLQQKELLQPQAETKQRLASAAEVLLSDYSAGGELTIFTILDSQDIHA